MSALNIWQPISTCPKNEIVLFWVPGLRSGFTTNNCITGEYVCVPDRYNSKVPYREYELDGYSTESKPTHWMELSEGPKNA